MKNNFELALEALTENCKKCWRKDVCRICAQRYAVEALKKQVEAQKSSKFNYWRNICEIQAEQTAKGLLKYGQVLEENKRLGINEHLRHLEEELIDGLMYIERIKAILNEEVENE